jgi:glyceraldehyde 3-phosphate dehydrogenase
MSRKSIISVDIIGNNHSAIVDGLSTRVIGGTGNLIKVLSWYDNEWGYSCRVVDLINFIQTGKKPIAEELNVVQHHN